MTENDVKHRVTETTEMSQPATTVIGPTMTTELQRMQNLLNYGVPEFRTSESCEPGSFNVVQSINSSHYHRPMPIEFIECHPDDLDRLKDALDQRKPNPVSTEALARAAQIRFERG